MSLVIYYFYFSAGFSHYSEPNKINLNALRLCFQVFLPDSNGRIRVPLPPVISTPIFDNSKYNLLFNLNKVILISDKHITASTRPPTL